MFGDLLTFVAQFTGKTQLEDHIERLVVAAFFWLTLIWLARHQRQYEPAIKRMLLTGFAIGFLREALMFIVLCLDATAFISRASLHALYPTVEHLLASISFVWISAAFLAYLHDPRRGRRFLTVGLMTTTVVFIATFPAWVIFSGAPPSAAFCETWYDRVWHINDILLIGYALVISVRIPGWPRIILFAAQGCFFLEDLLMLLNLTACEPFGPVYNPLGYSLHIVAIPLFGYIFMREQWERQELHEAELLQKKSAVRMLADTLEEQVLERTGQLARITNELNIILENAEVGICKVIDRKQVWVNHKIEELFQYSKEEIVNLTMRDLYPSDEAYEYQGARAYPVLAQGRVYEAEQVMVRKDGMHILLRMIGKAIDPSDPSQGSIWQLDDITQRKAAEEALRKSESLYHSLVETSQNIIWQCDAGGRFTYLNLAAEQVFGYELDEMRGRKFSDFQPPEFAARDLNTFRRLLEGDSLDSYETIFTGKYGNTIHVLINALFMSDEKGDIIGVTGTAYDITQRKQMEEELFQAKEAAEAANCAKSQFLATMSHEIRTPMNAMMGNLTLLASAGLEEQQQRCLQDCISASQMLMRVINDILDFSKIEAGKMELTEESYSPGHLFGSLVGIFAGRAEEKQLGLSFNISDQLPEFIVGDQQRLSQITSNLLSNAIKFTQQGGVTLSVAPETVDNGKLHLVVSVSDTGIGIPHDQKYTIFDSFTQLDNFNTRRHVGTGLGLAISKRLAKLMGGTITLASTPGVGSVFTVTIPVTCGAAPVIATQKGAQRCTARKILLADDEPLGRYVVTALLERHGHRVTAVENGAAVLDVLQRERFDVLLSDISMPDLDGTQVARIIRSEERPGIDARIPIIAMTAHAFPQDRDRFLEYGIDGYIAKPINFDELLELIEETCGTAVLIPPPPDPYGLMQEVV